MQTIRYADLSEPIRSFLSGAEREGGLLVLDESGRDRYVVRVPETVDGPRRQALRDLAAIQRRVGEAMKRQGLTEEDLDRALREDD